MWKIRAEINGEFVTRYEFESPIETLTKYDELIRSGLYDKIEVWKEEN